MKQICIIPTVIATIIFMLLFQSCNALPSKVADKALELMAKYDSTDFVTRTVDLADFTAIKCGGYAIIEYQQGENYNIEISSTAEYLDSYTFEVKKKELRIESNKNKFKRPLIIRLTAPRLDELDIKGACIFKAGSVNLNKDYNVRVSGAATIDIENLYCEDVEIDISGASKLKGTIHAKKDVEIENSGASNIDADIYCEKLEIDCSGASMCDLTVFCNDLDIDCSGTGKIYVEGKTQKQRISSSGPAKIDLSNLTTTK